MPTICTALAALGQRLTDQAQVVRIELHRLEGRERFVVQHVQVAENAPGLRVAAPSHQAQPARQAQQR
jgi:outer membrane lipoprotein SlyB